MCTLKSAKNTNLRRVAWPPSLAALLITAHTTSTPTTRLCFTVRCSALTLVWFTLFSLLAAGADDGLPECAGRTLEELDRKLAAQEAAQATEDAR